MLRVEGLTQGYRRTTVIEGLSLSLDPGVTALLGPNGAGKTTLLQTLATVLPPRRGRLVVAGHEVTSERSARAARRQVGYLPQHFGVEPGMRVRDLVTYAAWVRGVPSAQREPAVEEVLAYVGLEDRARIRMGKLSGGMRQRAGIAWALVGRPRVVLLDEPTVGLDPQQRLHFRQCLSGLKETTVLLSTHLTDDVDAICDHTVVMTGGRVIFSGSTETLKARDRPDQPGHAPIERAYIGLLTAGGGDQDEEPRSE